jgi:excisionase family DNA binding protein
MLTANAGESANMEKTMQTQLAMTVAEACAAARVGRTVLYELIRDGKLPARKCGRRTVVLVDDLRRWIEGLPSVQPRTSK